MNMRVAKKTIEDVLAKAELKYDLKKGILLKIYDAEARVVFLGLRRGISKDLRRIIQNATEGVVDEN